MINPMWAYGPGIEPGVDDSRVAAYDLYPTIANLFGIEAGKGSGFSMCGPDGESFVRSLRGAPVYRYCTYADRFPNGLNPSDVPKKKWFRMLRGAQFKFLVTRLQGRTTTELHDYVANPRERRNLLLEAAPPKAEPFLLFARRFLASF